MSSWTFDYVYNTIYDAQERSQINEEERERMRGLFNGSFRSLIQDRERRYREQQEQCQRQEQVVIERGIQEPLASTRHIDGIINDLLDRDEKREMRDERRETR
jgi:hypothetical protein